MPVKRRNLDKAFLNFQVNSDVYDLMYEYAKKTDSSLSRVCRSAIYSYIEELRRKKQIKKEATA